MSWTEELQEDLERWHKAKYPRASLEAIGLKLAEECGEACRAIDRIIHTSDDEIAARWKDNLAEEIGDAALVLLVLCNRIGRDFDLLLVERAEEVMSR